MRTQNLNCIITYQIYKVHWKILSCSGLKKLISLHFISSFPKYFNEIILSEKPGAQSGHSQLSELPDHRQSLPCVRCDMAVCLGNRMTILHKLNMS